MDQKQVHSPQRAPESSTYITIEKINEGARETQSLFSSACIYRVPEPLRKLNEDAYTPSLIAIGPLHQDDKHLQTPLQHVKLSYTNYLFCRLFQGVEELAMEKLKDNLLQKCLQKMNPLVEKAKKYYAEEVKLDEKMMLIDGCFILEFLCRTASNPKEEEEEHMKGGDSGNSKQRPLEEEEHNESSNNNNSKADPLESIFTRNGVQRDLLLLENQIPFFVLEELFELTVAQIPELSHKSLNHYVSSSLRSMMNPVYNSKNSSSSCSPCHSVLHICHDKERGNSKEEEEDVWPTDNYYHILHKLHKDSLPRRKEKTPLTKKKLPKEVMPSALNLKHAGIKFVPAARAKYVFNVNFSDPKCLYWCFKSANFEITPLRIYDSTETFLRNLIAFEQCCPLASKHFTSYAYLMDMLVNSDEDVKVLEKAGVVSNYLGASKEFTKLFNKLCTQIVVGEFHFADTCQKATEYSKRCGPKRMAELRRTYFASPWKFIALSVGFTAFVISVIQFIRSFLK